MKTEMAPGGARVDVIIPVHDVEMYLRRCLDSLKAQTCPLWRAICVDDGSTDGSGSILDEYAREDARFMVFHIPKGGVSKARNVAMSASGSEFIMFIDSDDLIHPQTIELALGLADRDGSDVVSWYRNTSYRLQVGLHRMLGLDTVTMRPWGYKRSFSLPDVASCVTDNILEHCTDLSHTDIKWPVKHFHIWKFLMRRDAVGDVRFIEGLDFEDFPWLSEVMMKDLKVTITNLPLYYRYPNGRSITHSTVEEDKLLCFLRGLDYTASLYASKAPLEKRELFSRNIKWSVIVSHVSGSLDKIEDGQKAVLIKDWLERLWTEGVFDDYSTLDQEKARTRVIGFISSEGRR